MVPVGEAGGTAAGLRPVIITGTQLAASPAGCRETFPSLQPQARPASHEPHGSHPLPRAEDTQSAARRAWAFQGQRPNSRTPQPLLFPSRLQEVGKSIPGRGLSWAPGWPLRVALLMPASRLRDRAAGSASGSTCGSMSQPLPGLESGLLASAACSAPRGPRKGGPAPVDRKAKASAMPDSPAEVKTQPRSTPPSMPPPPPAASQGATRPPSFTPHTLMNGSSHSPTAISGAPSTPNGFSNGPATSSTASLSTQHLPPACGARQLSKLKRFLTALQQFGSDISPEIGERVRTLVLGLVNSTLTIEEFHSKLQEATNFPLRPFVIPFLKANLPLLQRELLHCARLAKQTPAQYLAQHEQLLLDASASSPIDSSELLLEVNENGKRRTPDRTKENGLDRDPLHPEHLSKRPCTLNPAQRYSPSNGPPQPTPPHYRLEDIAMAHHFRDAYRHADPRELRERHRPLVVPGSRQEEVIDHKLTEREWAEEWKHLNNLLNCIMDMVEKTRRSLTVLRRCQEADREELNHWARRCSDTEDTKKGPGPATARPRSSCAGPEGCQLDVPREFLPRTLTGYMPEDIWRKAEEAVNEVKRQAMSELQKAVSDAERKAHELITTERAKMERALAEAKRQASEDALTVVNQQEDSSESCWNCGRKASETCSGCNAARYCGSFCQHRDWEKHHHVCGQSLQGPAAVVADPVPGPPEAAHGLGPSLPVGAASPSEAGSAGPSRPGSPSPPGPLDAVPR
ncbi:protein CBFA2T3 isoform X2 [Trachypithecus francoisi]|uniref:protein CBFA2T3 isoform X2 n=2 Tax=Trachypithecus francoisi TaxID=54180 RepID=UPI00141AD855|nr:protein CBFA2T3 isoform X2 [Trachypithecus francoisi]